MKSIYVSTPARVSLFGEYSKLIGETLTISLDKLQTKIEVSLSSDNFHSAFSKNFNERIEFETLELDGKWSDYIKASLIVLQKNNFNLPYLNFNISSNIPPKAGLASSSALIVSVIKGISELLNLGLSKKQVADLSYQTETVELNIPCGYMDFYSCSIGGVQYIKHTPISGPSLARYKLPKEAKIVIIETGKEKNTEEIISKIFEAHKKGEKRITDHIGLEKSLIKEARTLLKYDALNLTRLGQLIQQAHKSYQVNLRSSSPLHDQICDTAINAGALGAKISGGGFGGACFALTTKEKEVANALASLSNLVVISSINYSGSKLERLA